MLSQKEKVDDSLLRVINRKEEKIAAGLMYWVQMMSFTTASGVCLLAYDIQAHKAHHKVGPKEANRHTESWIASSKVKVKVILYDIDDTIIHE